MVLLGQADALHIPLPDESVHTCITSPPYWGLRSYSAGPAEIGLEASPDEYVTALVAVFREIWRVLRADGTVWLNLGDTYARDPSKGDRAEHMGLHQSRKRSGVHLASQHRSLTGLKPKDLVGIPWRVALALQADGWWLRSDIIWAKGLSFCPTYSGSVMPESVRDRPTQSYEHVFLLARRKSYYYDNVAVAEHSVYPNDDRKSRSNETQKRMPTEKIAGVRPGSASYPRRNLRSVWTIPDDEWAEFLQFREWKRAQSGLRDTWTINPKPSRLAHYAAFPPALVEPMVLASTSAWGCCPECGSPWERVIERTGQLPGRERNHGSRGDGFALPAQWKNGQNPTTITTIGWRPTCACYDGDYRRDFPQARSARKRYQRRVTGDWWDRVRRRPGKASWPVIPGIVLDCFSGTMTVGEVCAKHARHFIGLDLKREYVEMGRKRLTLDKMAAWNEAPADGEGESLGDLPLFRAAGRE